MTLSCSPRRRGWCEGGGARAVLKAAGAHHHARQRAAQAVQDVGGHVFSGSRLARGAGARQSGPPGTGPFEAAAPREHRRAFSVSATALFSRSCRVATSAALARRTCMVARRASRGRRRLLSGDVALTARFGGPVALLRPTVGAAASLHGAEACEEARGRRHALLQLRPCSQDRGQWRRPAGGHRRQRPLVQTDGGRACVPGAGRAGFSSVVSQRHCCRAAPLQATSSPPTPGLA